MTSPQALLPPCPTQVVSAFDADGRVSQAALRAAAAHLQAGWPVVIPSETVYGLAALATDPVAVGRVFSAKGRPADNPLIVHVTDLAQAERLGASPSPLAKQLAARYWPGPITFVIDCRTSLPWVTAGLDSLAVRCPAHPFFAALIELVGPLAAPSANRSGLPSPTRAAHAREDMTGRVPLIVDGGPVLHGIESTVVDARGAVASVLRPGSVTAPEWTAPTQNANGRTEANTPRAPGMKYRHYSPAAEVWLYPVDDHPERSLDLLCRDAAELRRQGLKVGIVQPQGPSTPEHSSAMPAGRGFAPSVVAHFAHHLFDQLRSLDNQAVECILVLGVPSEGLGHAVMDRLTRACSQRRLVETPSPFPALPCRRQHNSPLSEALEDQ